MEMRECVVCGGFIPLYSHGHTKYCSEKCKAEARNARRRKQRRDNYRHEPKFLCIRCGKPFRRFGNGPKFYCKACSKVAESERHKRNYRQKVGYVEKHYCPNCGVEVRVEGEAFCSRCRRKYKLLR